MIWFYLYVLVACLSTLHGVWKARPDGPVETLTAVVLFGFLWPISVPLYFYFRYTGRG